MVRYAGREAGLRSQGPEVRILSGAPLGVARGAGARGPLAQLVEQLTLNQRVGGSSPPRPTIHIEWLAGERGAPGQKREKDPAPVASRRLRSASPANPSL